MHHVTGLTVEYRTTPAALGVTRPRFGWQLVCPRAGTVQTAYRIVVQSADGATVWDSGEVASRECFGVVYDGQSLVADTTYHWRVGARINHTAEVVWSEFATFSMVKLDAPWRAGYIAPQKAHMSSVWAVPALRREFDAPGDVTEAFIYASALGWYTITINGHTVSHDVFAPGWTEDQHRIPYHRIDITPYLRPGTNVWGVTLAKGWYHNDFFLDWGRSVVDPEQFDPPAFIGEMHLCTSGGTTLIGSDAAWVWHPTQILHASMYGGEDVDARLALPGWDAPGYDASGWRPVDLLPLPTNRLCAPTVTPARVRDGMAPIALLTTPKGEWVLDMGQNMVGWLTFDLIAPAGEKIELRYFEVLDADGNVYTDNLVNARAQTHYTTREGVQSYRPQYTHFGFRYVHIAAWPAGQTPDLSQFTGEVIYGDMTPTGHFECSDAQVNQLCHNALWGQMGNFVDVPTDCPQRDERLGWTGDAQIFARTACFFFNVNAFFTKWLGDVALAQGPDGAVPWVVPDVLHTGGDAAWGDAATIVPWTLYRCYGDEGILRTQYDSMVAWVDYIRAQGPREAVWETGHQFGDWLSLGDTTDIYCVAQAMFAHSARLVADTAAVLGRRSDEREYRDLSRAARKAFRREYLTATGRVACPTQTAHVLALHFGLCKKKHRARILADLIKLLEKSNYHIATGFVGTPYLCHVLTDNGRHDIAAKVFLQRDYPGWLYPVGMGATTIWERWDGIKPDGTFQDPDMNSFNHYAYGSVIDWMVACVAGLDIAEPGYRAALMRPHITPGLTHARAHCDTPLGEYSCGWALEGNQMTVQITVPANGRATVVLDSSQGAKIAVNDSLSAAYPGVRWQLDPGKPAVAEVGSGEYVFKYQLAEKNS